MSMRNRLLAFVIALCAAGSGWAGTRERLSLDEGWRFLLGDVPLPQIKGHGASYANAQTGQADGPRNTDFDDSQWRRVKLPHDWAVEGPFDAEQNRGQGYRPRGIGWYRRYFRLPASDIGRHVELQFDGIATHSTVWVNGVIVNRNWSGYNGRSIDVTPYLRYGEEVNTIAVRVDAEELDRDEVHTGFRTIRFDADRGFFLNGQPMKLQGVAIHQDHAGVGDQHQFGGMGNLAVDHQVCGRVYVCGTGRGLLYSNRGPA